MIKDGNTSIFKTEMGEELYQVIINFLDGISTDICNPKNARLYFDYVVGQLEKIYLKHNIPMVEVISWNSYNEDSFKREQMHAISQILRITTFTLKDISLKEDIEILVELINLSISSMNDIQFSNSVNGSSTDQAEDGSSDYLNCAYSFENFNSETSISEDFESYSSEITSTQLNNQLSQSNINLLTRRNLEENKTFMNKNSQIVFQPSMFINPDYSESKPFINLKPQFSPDIFSEINESKADSSSEDIE